MNTSETRVLHVAPWVTTGGGIETMLAWHHRQDPAHGLDGWQLALFDKTPDAPAQRRSSLRAGWRDTLRGMRRKFAAAVADHPGATVIYHNAWGLPLFADLDRAERRLAFLHGGPQFLEPFLPRLRGWIDGVLTVSPAGSELTRSVLADLEPERHHLVLAPVQPPAQAETRRVEAPWVIGYVGRLEKTHKRADQLPAFIRELDRAGVRARVEVLGDGPLRGELERKLAARVVFHGWKTGDEYWRILAGWQAAFFLSDSEGLPLALIEAMSAGVLPFFPAIGGSMGDLYSPQVDARCYYPAGDLAALAARIHELSTAPLETLEAMRRRARELAARHHPDAYGADFADFVRRMNQLPRVSSGSEPRRARLADQLPLGAITRFLPGALWR